MKTNSSSFAIFLVYLAFAVLWFFKTPVDVFYLVFQWVDKWLNKKISEVLGE